MTEQLLLLFWLAIKHGVCDLALQAIYCRPSNKHNLFSPKAGLHSLHHVSGTFIVLLFFVSTPIAIGLSLIDGLSHHVIDHTKSTLVKKYNWTQDGKMYWVATTVDQNLHFTIYFLICLLAI
tara:strand:+ start:454 stop:819 length:366 start_codon:yes stop_codon:yes gene_type:complete